MGKYKTINATPASWEALDKMAAEMGTSKTDLLDKMVAYISITKADITRPKEPDSVQALVKKVADLDKRIIGFIKNQEKQILKPMQTEIEIISKEIGAAQLKENLGAMNDNIYKIGMMLKQAK